MDISTTALFAQCNRALAEWPWIWQTEQAYGLPRGLLLAVGSRETNLTDETGDGGHGHGVWQLHDRSHIIPSPFPVELQAQTAAGMLQQNYERAKSWQGACNIYNSGQPADAGTTGHDYGSDVMGRQAAIAAHYPALEVIDVTPGMWVRLLYELCLGRIPDGAAYTADVEALTNGTQTPEGLMVLLQESEEGQAYRADRPVVNGQHPLF